MKFQNWRIDWPNHLIAFFSALFGILIAFELDQWRESRNNFEDAHNAFVNIKKEVETNKTALHAVIDENLKRLETLENYLMPYINNKLGFTGEVKTAIEINSQVYPIARINISDSLSSNIDSSIIIHIGSLSHPTIHYSAWESAKATGVINHLEYEKVLTISYLYNSEQILDELQEIRLLVRKSDEINSKQSLKELIAELKESHYIIQRELVNYDMFASMIQSME
jgi:hypothetical protein